MKQYVYFYFYPILFYAYRNYLLKLTKLIFYIPNNYNSQFENYCFRPILSFSRRENWNSETQSYPSHGVIADLEPEFRSPGV